MKSPSAGSLGGCGGEKADLPCPGETSYLPRSGRQTHKSLGLLSRKKKTTLGRFAKKAGGELRYLEKGRGWGPEVSLVIKGRNLSTGLPARRESGEGVTWGEA